MASRSISYREALEIATGNITTCDDPIDTLLPVEVVGVFRELWLKLLVDIEGLSEQEAETVLNGHEANEATYTFRERLSVAFNDNQITEMDHDGEQAAMQLFNRRNAA